MLALLLIACKPVKKSLPLWKSKSALDCPPLPSTSGFFFFSPGITFSRPVCFKCWSALGLSRELIKASVTGLLSQSLWCSRFGIGSKTCNSNKFPGEADSWGPSVRPTAPKNTLHWLIAYSLFSFATPPGATWPQPHHHWHPHVEFSGHFVSSWDPCNIAHPTTSFFLIWLPWHQSLPITSITSFLSACSFWDALTEILFRKLFHSQQVSLFLRALSLLAALLNSYPSWDASSVPGASIAMPIILVDSSAMHLSSSTASVYPDSWG